MIDWFGHWHYDESDPKKKWCDYDYLAREIIKSGYKPKASIEHLCDMIFSHYDGEIEQSENGYFVIEQGELGVCTCIEDVLEYVNASGGFREFDYEP